MWEVSTGKRVAEIADDKHLGARVPMLMALDADGSHLFTQVTRPKRLPTSGFTIQEPEGLLRWRLSDGSRQEIRSDLRPHWQRIIPLGSDLNSPVVLLRNNMVGLVAPRDGAAPTLRRLVIPDLPYLPFRNDSWNPDAWADGLCGVLPPGTEPAASDQDLPPGTDTGPPCE